MKKNLFFNGFKCTDFFFYKLCLCYGPDFDTFYTM